MVNQLKISLKDRLNTRDDYLIIGIICAIYVFSFIALMLVPDPKYGGLIVAGRFVLVFGIFPFGLIAGMLFDRNLAKDLIQRLDSSNEIESSKFKEDKISKEDIYRIIMISAIVIFSLPWIGALLGINSFLFWNPVHIGENHGYYGFILVLFCILNTKIIKYNRDSIAREGIIFGFIGCSVWGSGWMLDDFLIEQFNFSLGFDTPLIDFSLNHIPTTFIFQLFIVGAISFLIYYVFWWKYYKNKIPILQDFN